MKSTLLKVLILLLAMVPLTFAGVGVFLARLQHHKIRTYQPVQATVLASRVKVRTSHSRNGTSRSYKPIIEFRYEVNGRSYTCDQVTPLDNSGSRKWAYGLVRRFRPGQAVQAYYDPRFPADAFLIKRYSFFPYFFLLFSVPGVALLVVIAGTLGVWRRAPAEPLASPGGQFELRPASRIADRKRLAWIATLAWHGVGGMAGGHYFVVAQGSYETMALISMAVYEVFGLVPLGLVVYYSRLGRHIGDAKVMVNTQRFALGDTIAVRAEQSVYAPLLIEELSLGLVCQETTRTRTGTKTTISTRTCYEKRVPVLKDYPTQPGQAITANATLVIPADGQPTTPAKVKSYPHYAWWIEVLARIPAHPDYRGKFPIVVQPAAANQG